MMKFAIAVAVLATLSAAPVTGFAQETVEPEPIVGTEVAKPISAALLLGFGTDIGEDANFFGLGIGARGGYNLERLYLGGVFVFHLGGSTETTTDGFSTAEFDYNMWLLGAEAGYEFPVIDRLIIRPSVILGISHFSFSTDNPLFGESLSDTKLLLSLGATALYDVAPDIFVGGELRLPFALGGESVVGLIIYATGGMRF